MAINENLSTLENSNSRMGVTLHQNYLKKDGSYYVRVNRNNAKFNNIISEISEENKGIDPHLLQYAAILIQKKILKLLEQGKAVNLLDIGTLYISMKCNAKDKKDVQGKGTFGVKFAPTQLTLDSVASLDIGSIIYADPNVYITEVVDLYTNKLNDTLTREKPAKITGSKLKLGSKESGIYFAPIDNIEEINSDESTWIKVPENSIFRNKPAELNFFVPNNIEPGRYCILIRTDYITTTRHRKEVIETMSNPITII